MQKKHKQNRLIHLFCQDLFATAKIFNLVRKPGLLLEMTAELDEIVRSIGKQNCNQTNMISWCSDHANSASKHG